MIPALAEDVISVGRFFAYGSQPVNKGNSSALSETIGTIWPVVISWAHLAENGKVRASNAYVSCLRAADGNIGSPEDPRDEESSETSEKNPGMANELSPAAFAVAIGATMLLLA